MTAFHIVREPADILASWLDTCAEREDEREREREKKGEVCPSPAGLQLVCGMMIGLNTYPYAHSFPYPNKCYGDERNTATSCNTNVWQKKKKKKERETNYPAHYAVEVGLQKESRGR